MSGRHPRPHSEEHSKEADPITHRTFPTPQERARAQRRGGRKLSVRPLIKRLRKRAQKHVRVPLLVRPRIGTRMGKRKAALALSVGAMGLSTAAADFQPPQPAAQMSIDPTVRRHASLLQVSDAMKEALLEEEGARDTVYRDAAGYPTVGVGHLVTPADELRVGDRVSRDRILDFLEADLREAEAAVVRLVADLPVNQHEFDALADLAFNVGEGTLSPTNSPRLNAAVAMRDYAGIAAELGYHFADGAQFAGLVNRSERRANIFLAGSYDDPRDQV